jgi:hypothetical protein
MDCCSGSGGPASLQRDSASAARRSREDARRSGVVARALGRRLESVSRVQSYVCVTRVRDASIGSSSQRHRCPGGRLPSSAGVQAMRRPSSNSTTWFSRTLPRVNVITKTSPTAWTRCPVSARARLSFPSQRGCWDGSAISAKNPVRGCGDLAHGADHAWFVVHVARVVTSGHRSIQHTLRDGG